MQSGALVELGIIPAYAGSTVEPSEMLTAQKDHPRIRGEHVHIEAPRCPQMGSSPHTRGAQEYTVTRSRKARIIPAYAGSTVQVRILRVARMDHPRIRGEHK